MSRAFKNFCRIHDLHSLSAAETNLFGSLGISHFRFNSEIRRALYKLRQLRLPISEVNAMIIERKQQIMPRTLQEFSFTIKSNCWHHLHCSCHCFCNSAVLLDIFTLPLSESVLCGQLREFNGINCSCFVTHSWTRTTLPSGATFYQRR